jgi:hypothetical protein
MIDEKDPKTPEEEFEVVELPQGQTPETTVAAPQEDERLRNEEDTEDEDTVVDGETAEQAAERKREARRKRRERQKRGERESKEQIYHLSRMNQELLSRLNNVEARNLYKEAEEVDNRMRVASQRYKRAEMIIAEASSNNDGEALAAALRARDNAANEYANARSVRERISQLAAPEATIDRRPQGPDPRMVERARAFAEKHPWLDPMGEADDDSAVVQGLDIALTKRGLDPRTDEYWDALEKATRAKLPHRFRGDDTGRRGPPVAGGSDRAGSGKRQFFLSSERKAAMQQDGSWDDPVARQRMLRKYAEYDAQNRKS